MEIKTWEDCEKAGKRLAIDSTTLGSLLKVRMTEKEPEERNFKSDLESAKTAQGVYDIYWRLHSGNDPSGKLRASARRKLNALLGAMLKQMSGLSSLKVIYSLCPHQGKMGKLVAARIDALLDPMLTKAKTSKQALRVFKNATYGSKVQTEAGYKLLRLSDSFQTCETVYDLAPHGSALRREAKAKRNMLFQAFLADDDTTLQRLKSLLERLQIEGDQSSHDDANKEVLVLRAMLKRSKSEKQLRKLFDLVPPWMDGLRQEVLRKLVSLI